MNSLLSSVEQGYGKTFFSRRFVQHWNKLPESVANAVSLDSFKTNLDKYCKEKGLAYQGRSALIAIKHFEAALKVYICIYDCMLSGWPFGAWSALCTCTMLMGGVDMCCAALYGPMWLLVAQ